MAIVDPIGRLSKIPLFRGLSPQALRFIGDLAHEKEYPATSVLFAQGDVPTHFWLVMRGLVLETGTAGGAPVIRLEEGRGSPVGRWSVFNGLPHTTTAVVVQEATLLSIPVADLQALFTQLPVLRQRLARTEIASRLLGIPLFSSFAQEQLFQAADLLEVVELKAGAFLWKEGDGADAFYVIDFGRVAVQAGSGRGRGSPRYLGAGAFVGQEEMLSGTPRATTAKADSDTTLYRFSTTAFNWLGQLRSGFMRALAGIDVVALLAGIPVLADLGRDDLELLAGYVGLAHLPRGDTLLAQGEVDSTLYLLVEGQAERQILDESLQPRPMDPMRAGEVMGERSLFGVDPWAFTVRATTRTTWVYLTQEDLKQFLLRKPATRGKLVPPDKSLMRTRSRHLPWLEADEKPLLVRRRHAVALIRPLIGWPGVVLWMLALALAAIPWGKLAPGLDAVRLVAPVLSGLWLVWCVLDYWNDTLIVTFARVVHREKVIGLFESLSEVPLAKIQNVSIRQDFWGGLLGYGRLSVETAAASGIRPLSFTYLRSPEMVKTLLLEAVERIQSVRKPASRRQIRERIEATTQPGLRALLRRPAAPPSATKVGTARAGPVARLLRATLGRLFWVERRTGDKVTWRKHPLRLLARVWVPTLLVAAAGLTYGLWLAPLGVSPWVLAVVLVPLGAWWWWGWADWGNDLYIVTRDRIIDTERRPLRLRSSRTETLFDRVQNVTYELPTLVANLFDFGTVSIYTAGAQGKLDFQYVAHPQRVQAEIFGRLAAFEEEQRRKLQERADLGDWFGVYEQLH